MLKQEFKTYIRVVIAKTTDNAGAGSVSIIFAKEN
jgi:hypothetical protein